MSGAPHRKFLIATGFVCIAWLSLWIFIFLTFGLKIEKSPDALVTINIIFSVLGYMFFSAFMSELIMPESELISFNPFAWYQAYRKKHEQ
jgi:membrane protein DedA with SNARE-associated domain